MHFLLRPLAPPVTSVGTVLRHCDAGKRPAPYSPFGAAPAPRVTSALCYSVRVGAFVCNTVDAQTAAAATDAPQGQGLTTTLNETQNGRETIVDWGNGKF